LNLLRLNTLVWIWFLLLLAGCACQGGNISSRQLPPLSAGSSPFPALKDQIDAMIASELSPYSLAAIKIVSLKSGATIYETNPSLLLPPASLQKLFTAAASLSLLGSDHTIETSISLSPDHKTIYLKGCGDPLLKTADLATMVKDIAAKLPVPRQFNMVGDSGCFDELYWGSGWMWDDEPSPEAMYISPLSVNGNSVSVTVTPGQEPLSSVVVVTEPSTSYLRIENSAKTGTPGGACAVRVTRPPGDRDNIIQVAGSLAPDCPAVNNRVTLWRPELYTVILLTELLDKAGVKAESPSIGAAPADVEKLTVIRHTLQEIVTEMLKTSDNLSAENLLKYLAHAQTGQKGSADKGTELVKEYLRQNNIATDKLLFVDGSGVSRYNLASADAVTRLLVSAYKDQSISPVFVNALPVAGIDGTLAGRMKGTPAEGRVKAKTGTMSGLSALAGYTTTVEGEPLAFAMIMQNFVGSPQRIRDLQDRLAVLLSTFSSK
jgi:D-alanyl-D-alanine carboxypeptidase/D-alanyl-D-alanine-endopeptidase (penicillin-binding protein 4)